MLIEFKEKIENVRFSEYLIESKRIRKIIKNRLLLFFYTNALEWQTLLTIICLFFV